MIEVAGNVTAAEVQRMIEERRKLAQTTTDPVVLRALLDSSCRLQEIADGLRQAEWRKSLAERWRHNAEILEATAGEPGTTQANRAALEARASAFRRCAEDLLERMGDRD